jgi:hypothetical protein
VPFSPIQAQRPLARPRLVDRFFDRIFDNIFDESAFARSAFGASKSSTSAVMVSVVVGFNDASAVPRASSPAFAVLSSGAARRRHGQQLMPKINSES